MRKCNIGFEKAGVAELLLFKHLVLMFSLLQSYMFSEVRHHGPRFQLRFWLGEGCSQHVSEKYLAPL